MEWQEVLDDFVRQFKIFGLNIDPKIMRKFLTCQGELTLLCFLEMNLLESQNLFSKKRHVRISLWHKKTHFSVYEVKSFTYMWGSQMKLIWSYLGSYVLAYNIFYKNLQWVNKNVHDKYLNKQKFENRVLKS